MSDRIEVNAGYRLVGCMKDMPRRLCYVCGRQGNVIQVLLVSGIATAEVRQFAREFAQVRTPGGLYNLMPCNRVSDCAEIAEIVEILKEGAR